MHERIKQQPGSDWDEINAELPTREEQRELEQDLTAWLAHASTRQAFKERIAGSADYTLEGSSYGKVLQDIVREIEILDASIGSETLLQKGSLFVPYADMYLALPEA